MLLLFSVTAFLSAALLFALEPMFARMVLPLLGGSPAVWNTAMLFYQAALLAGYGYAHTLSQRGERWRAAHVTLMVVALLLLPIRVEPSQIPPGSGGAFLWLARTMAVTIGLPFLLIAATGPMIQRWFSQSSHPRARDPYFLYGPSNVGSLLGLLAFPFLLEPRWPLDQQARIWTWGYVALAALVTACALAVRGRALAEVAATSQPESAEAQDRPVDWRRRVLWLALAFAPSSLMLGVTTHLSTELIAMPLLWVIPLAVYLLTFTLAFARRSLVPTRLVSQVLVLAVLGVLIVLQSRATEPVPFLIGLHLGALFAGGLACHGRLASDRPSPHHLTEFYLWVGIGGALGGVFNAIVAPAVFHSVTEYPVALVLVCLLAPPWTARARVQKARIGAPDRRRARLANEGGTTQSVILRRDIIAATVFAAIVATVIFGARAAGHEWRRAEFVVVLAVLCFPMFSFRRRPVRFALGVASVLLLTPLAVAPEQRTVFAARTFFGIHRVQAVPVPEGTMHQLVHGTTIHGLQWIAPARCDEPLSYHHRSGPAGQVFAALGQMPRAMRIGVTGLGTGALSAYARPGQSWTYFELDPTVVRIATNPEWFCYVEGAPTKPRILLGDARLSLASDTTRFDLLVLDAYASDAIPVHLLTREAFREYLEHLAPDGALALNVSNRFFDLEPVVARLARDAGLACRVQLDDRVSKQERSRGRTVSHWAVLARREEDLLTLASDERWRLPRTEEAIALWTDNFSSLVSVLR